MTKETIIDGINVAECAYYYSDNSVFRLDWCCFHHCSESWNGKCDSVPDCYYKQLQRKTAECEELKQEYEDILSGQREWEEENERYIQALDEIETYCNEYGQNSIGFRKNILDIVRKAKDGNYELYKTTAKL